MGKSKRITLDEQCDKYERLVEMWENLADSMTRCFGDYDKEYPSCGKCNFKEMCQMKKSGIGVK